MHINLIKPTASYDVAMLNEKGMIPKGKGGDFLTHGGHSELAMCHHPVVSWGNLLDGRENHRHAHACTHSPRRAFWVVDVLPTRLICESVHLLSRKLR